MKKGKFGCCKRSDKIGVLLAQLGTPEEPTARGLRPYLRQFLGDPRVIETNRALWWVILNGIILPFRSPKSARLYQRIWTDEGSPLLVITERQTEKLRAALQSLDPEIEVEYGMRYGKPSIESAIDALIEKGCSRLLLFNMYAQYSGTTSASNYDAAFMHLMTKRWVPTLRIAEPYYAHPAHIRALATTINASLQEMTQRPEKLVLSYHGIPQKYVQKGDPYCCQCTETTAALKPHIEFPDGDIIHTYQSRFGKDPWLNPYTDQVIEGLAKDGVKHIAVACPGFVTDCLETLDEMGNEAEEEFIEAGGETLQLIPCLNDSTIWIEGMREIVLEELGSWLDVLKRNREQETTIKCPVPGMWKAA